MLRPPVGIALLGFMAFVAGIVYIVQGLRFMNVVTFGPAELGDGLFLWGVFGLIVGIAWVSAAYAAWSLQPWAWSLGIIMAIFGLINAVIVLFTTNSLAYGLGVAIWPLVVIWYLNLPDIKAAFGLTADGGTPSNPA